MVVSIIARAQEITKSLYGWQFIIYFMVCKILDKTKKVTRIKIEFGCIAVKNVVGNNFYNVFLRGY